MREDTIKGILEEVAGVTMQFFDLPKISHKIKQFTLQDDQSICINAKILEGDDQPPKVMRPEYYPSELGQVVRSNGETGSKEKNL